jgi:hypothetical protein
MQVGIIDLFCRSSSMDRVPSCTNRTQASIDCQDIAPLAQLHTFGRHCYGCPFSSTTHTISGSCYCCSCCCGGGRCCWFRVLHPLQHLKATPVKQIHLYKEGQLTSLSCLLLLSFGGSTITSTSSHHVDGGGGWCRRI